MNNNNYARGISVILYFIMSVLNIAIGFVHTLEESLLAWILIAYHIITFVLLAFVCTKQRVSTRFHFYISGILMIIVAWGAGFNAGNMGAYYMMCMLPLISMMTYMLAEEYKKFLFIFFGQMILSFFVPSNIFADDFSHLMQISYVIIELFIGLLLLYFLRIMQYRDRYVYEQEISVNDMQKVIMAKCLEAKNATRSKSDFLSNMSHEIRTPLNAILGMNEMIMRENRDDTIARYAGNIDRSGQMLLSLINDILDFSKIESGRLDLVKTDYQFFTIVKDIVTMLDSRFKKKELKLITNISSDIPKVLNGDEVRIKQIITNIMTNAVKYTDEGSVEFSVSAKRNSSNERCDVVIIVSDTGQGMSEENLSQIFDSFSRFNLKANRQIEGTGLGMAITKRLVDTMGGEIRVESKLGEGTTFTVILPQVIVDNTESGDFNSFNSRESEAKKRQDTKFVRPDAKVLIVDDSRVNLAVAKGLLKYTKMQVTTVSSGEECLEKLKNEKYNIVLLDHMMPGMDGLETLKHIRDEHICDKTPVIALTANAVGNAKEMYLSHGFNDYLSKPITGDRIEEIMRLWVGTEDND